MKKIYLSDLDRKIFGVCGGIARYMGVDSTIIRLLFVVLALILHGIPLILYFVAWLIMPGEPGYKTIEMKR